MKVTISALLLFVAFVTNAQNRETRSVSTFNSISFRISGKIFLTQGSPQKVELEGPADVLSKITTEVTSGRLVVGNEKKWNNRDWRDGDQIKIYISVKDIEGLDVSGSGDLVAQNKLVGDNFNIDLSGSGSLTAEIHASGDFDLEVSGSGSADINGQFASMKAELSGSGGLDLNAKIAGKAKFDLSGSGKIRAEGSAKEVRVSINGSGNVDAVNMETDECNVDISGSGDVKINVKSSLDVNVSGSGSVSYKGNPAHVNSHSAGSGNIRSIN